MSYLRRDEKARFTLFGLVLLVHISAWTVALALRPPMVTPRQIVAEMCSTLVIVGLSLNLVLATRARPLERSLAGLDKLFVTHRTVGLSLAVIALTHYLLVPKSVGYVPSKPVGYTQLTLLLLVVFVASAPRFPWRRLVPLKYETWKATHRLNGLLVVIGSWHSLLAFTYVKHVPGLAVYVYGIAAMGLAAWLYRELLASKLGPISAHRIASARDLPGDSVRELSLAPLLPRARTAGQFALLTLWVDGRPQTHPFTISSPVGDPLRFSIKASGDFTRSLPTRACTGDPCRVEGPYGAFVTSAGRTHQVWLAGGIGITPFLAMAADLPAERRVLLVWSVRERSEAVYAAELLKRAAEHPGLVIRVHPTSELGHLDVTTLTPPAPWEECSAYVCGPVPMRVALERDLRRTGVPRADIHYEEFRLR